MFNFLPYFKKFAECHPDILHDDFNESRIRFHRANGTASIDEILLNQKAISDGFGIICIDSDSGLFGSNGYDSFSDTQFYTLAVWGKANEVDDFDKVEAVKRGKKAIAIDIRNKMIKDYYAHINGLANLNIKSIRYQSSGPFADHYYLTFINFTIQEPTKICQIPNSLNFQI